jgi:hypothetical protein
MLLLPFRAGFGGEVTGIFTTAVPKQSKSALAKGLVVTVAGEQASLYRPFGLTCSAN